MALKFVQVGLTGGGAGGGGTYDHNLLVNRGLPDQHTIESITGLRQALDRKYEKPFSGIPKSDLAFPVATMTDLDSLRRTDLADLRNQINAVTEEVQEARGGLNRLKEYIDTKVSRSEWSGGGGSGGGHVDSQIGYPLYQEIKPQEGQTLIALNKEYRMGTRQLEVYLNGIRMVQNDDYVEVDPTHIEFQYPLESDDLVVCQVRAVINSGLHEEYYATAGQTRFRLQSPYGIHQNILQVYRNGVLQRKGRDYLEIDNITVDFVVPLEEQDFITFIQPGATDPLAGTVMQSEIGRVKVNLGYTTMMLHDAVGTPETDYMDMYIDTFITDNNIDKTKSFAYDYVNKSIQVCDINRSLTAYEDFAGGTVVNTDIETFPGRIVLRNMPGGGDRNSFQTHQVFASGTIITDTLIVRNQFRDVFRCHVRQNGMDHELVVGVTPFGGIEATISVETISGIIQDLNGVFDSQGRLHLAYTAEANGRSKIAYVIINRDATVSTLQVASDENYDAKTPDIDIGPDDKIHVVFVSKRVHTSYFNVDYVIIDKDLNRSAYKNITTYSAYGAENPRIAVGSDGKARIVYESIEYDGQTKNIKFVVVNNLFQEFEAYITTSTSFDNIMPDIDIDANNTSKIVWRSRRLDANFGLDYCSVSQGNIISSVKMVASGLICSRPRIQTDYEGISHVVFSANYIRSDTDNICYSMVYADDSVDQFISIAEAYGVQMTNPKIHVYGDEIRVAFLGDVTGYEQVKSLSNYTGLGVFDMVFDSITPDTQWLSIQAQVVLPNANTSAVVEYRISNDGIGWTDWQNIAALAPEKVSGRYLHLRASLTSTDSASTPEIESFDVVYRPSFIEVQSVPKASNKDVDSIIPIGRYEGDVIFYVSRDGGTTFQETFVNTAADLTGSPAGRDVVIKARIADGSKLDAWGALW